ncbi:MAG: hypothetical protein IT486_06520 [Gammaproteobacteria bacterium]|nr:hypothetical protein [Gammaproteobacteria bacterium]
MSSTSKKPAGSEPGVLLAEDGLLHAHPLDLYSPLVAAAPRVWFTHTSRFGTSQLVILITGTLDTGGWDRPPGRAHGQAWRADFPGSSLYVQGMTASSQTRVLAIGAVLLLAARPGVAGPRHYLAADETLCSSPPVACIEGTLSYEGNERLLWLTGRVDTVPGPGLFIVTLRGSNRLGHVRHAPMEIALRGHRGEIVDFRMIPDYPDVANWRIDRIEFRPGPANRTDRRP